MMDTQKSSILLEFIPNDKTPILVIIIFKHHRVSQEIASRVEPLQKPQAKLYQLPTSSVMKLASNEKLPGHERIPNLQVYCETRKDIIDLLLKKTNWFVTIQEIFESFQPVSRAFWSCVDNNHIHEDLRIDGERADQDYAIQSIRAVLYQVLTLCRYACTKSLQCIIKSFVCRVSVSDKSTNFIPEFVQMPKCQINILDLPTTIQSTDGEEMLMKYFFSNQDDRAIRSTIHLKYTMPMVYQKNLDKVFVICLMNSERGRSEKGQQQLHWFLFDEERISTGRDEKCLSLIRKNELSFNSSVFLYHLLKHLRETNRKLKVLLLNHNHNNNGVKEQISEVLSILPCYSVKLNAETDFDELNEKQMTLTPFVSNKLSRDHRQKNGSVRAEKSDDSKSTEKTGVYIRCKSLQSCEFDGFLKQPNVCYDLESFMFDKKEFLWSLCSAGCDMQDECADTCDVKTEKSNRKNPKMFEDNLYQATGVSFFQKLVVAPLVSLRSYFDEVAQGKKHSVQEEMVFEGLRLKTFHKVKIPTSSIHLAAAGFYATGEEDETRCFSCGVRYRRWHSKDIPIQVHRRISPDCSYITGSDTSNVPIDSTASPSVSSADLMNGDARAESSSWIRNENNSNVGASTVGGMINNQSNINYSIAVDSSINQANVSNTETTNTPNFNNAVYPHYSDTKARMTSFSTWPPGHCKKPADLVLVGFFYAGYADCVRCFVCGVGLRTWEAGDDPWEEHVRWRSSCDFVRAVKGEEFIAQTLAAIGRASQQTDPRVSNGLERNNSVHGGNGVSNILSRDVCRQAIEMGFSTELVRQHATDIVRAQGDRPLQLEVLLEKLLQDNGNSQGETVQQTHSATREQTTPITQEPELPIRNYPENCPAEPQQTAPRDNTYSNNTHEVKHMTGAQQSTLNIESSNTPSMGKRINDLDHEGRQAEEKYDEQQARHNPAGEDFGDEGYVGSNDMMDDPEDTLAINSMSTMGSKSEAKPQTLSHPGSNRPDTVLLTTISEENRELRESNLCKICLDDPANIVFLPCGHLVACAVCTPALERCPVCRSFIRGSVRAHLTSMSSVTNHDS